jgi:nucleoid DNA-binding protein
MAVTTTDIIRGIADELEWPQQDVKIVINEFFNQIELALGDGEPIRLTGYLAINHGYRAGKKKGDLVRNPFNGTTRKLEAGTPGKITIRARPLKKLKDAAPVLNSKVGRSIKAARTK